MVEVLVALVALLIVLGGVTSSLFASSKLVQASREASLAVDGAQSALAELATVPFDEVYARFNDDPSDDPTADSPGADFDVAGLSNRGADPDGHVGRITFPGDGVTLREDDPDASLGMPRDLNLDGAIDALDHATDYRVLPVRVVVEWQSGFGERRVMLTTTLVGE